MTKDWYRNKTWNTEVEEKFFEKLNRSRSNRDQYLVIQALTLASNFPDATLRLVAQYFETRNDKFNDTRALLAKTEAYLAMDKLNMAIESYHALLESEDEYPRILSGAYVDYPYLVATQKIETEYENALNVLKKHVDRLAFPLERFKWYAAKALIENDENFASKALEAAKVKKSGFRFHQNLGLVGKEHAITIKNLRKICT